MPSAEGEDGSNALEKGHASVAHGDAVAFFLPKKRFQKGPIGQACGAIG